MGVTKLDAVALAMIGFLCTVLLGYVASMCRLRVCDSGSFGVCRA